MTLNELRYIVALGRERHFGRAAKACFVSQPTLSVAVKKLEDELGVALFERHPGEIGITPIGRQIIDQAQRVLEDAAQIRQLAQSGGDPLNGELRLGAIFTIGPYLLPHVIPRLRQLAPKMPLVIEENYTVNLAEKLKRGELDVIVISLPFSDPALSTWALYDEPFSVVLPTDHPLAKRDRIASRDLADENLLLLGSGHCFRDQVVEACPECITADTAGTLTHTVEGSSLETIRQMVASGLGVTVLPATSIGTPGPGALWVEKPFAGRTPQRTVALAWRKSYPRGKAINVLQNAILDSELPRVKYLPDQVPTA